MAPSDYMASTAVSHPLSIHIDSPTICSPTPSSKSSSTASTPSSSSPAPSPPVVSSSHVCLSPSSSSLDISATTASGGPLPRNDSVQTLISLLSPTAAGHNDPHGDDDSGTSTIRGADGTGRAYAVRITSELEVVTLSGLGLHNVSVAPLALGKAAALREISLAANALTEIDLAPLAACADLTVLALNSNKLSSIDLSPLRACRRLERLWLHDNRLSSVDLSPLTNNRSLRSLYLDDNCIHSESVDLSPLRSALHLRSLRLAGNALGGRLDVTPLLEVPALSQLHVANGVCLVATGESSQARISPALRRRVLDISFCNPPTPSVSLPELLTHSPSVTTANTAIALKGHVSTSSPYLSRPRSRPRTKPSPPSISRITGNDTEVATAPVGLHDSRGIPTVGLEKAIPASPHGLSVRKPSVSATCKSDGLAPETLKTATSPVSPASPRASPSPSPVVQSLLVGFRRLARYAAEDGLSRCGKISISAAEADQATSSSTNPSSSILTVDRAHVVAVYAPSEETLLRVLTRTRKCQPPVPVFVVGTERYRATNEEMLRQAGAVGSGTSGVVQVRNGTGTGAVARFVTDPIDAQAAKEMFALGLACACGLAAAKPSSQGESVNVSGRAPRMNAMPAVETIVNPQVAGSGKCGTCTIRKAASESRVPRSPRMICLPAMDVDGENESRKVSSGDLVIDLEDEDVQVETPCVGSRRRAKEYNRESQSLDGPSSSAAWTVLHAPTLGGKKSLNPGLSLSLRPANALAELNQYNASKLRAERAAIEVAFHDFGGNTASALDFCAVARACGMPKCAGRLLFTAVGMTLAAVEATTPETGVPEVRGGAERRLGIHVFLQYWEARLRFYDGETRLINVILDAHSGGQALGDAVCQHEADDARNGEAGTGDCVTTRRRRRKLLVSPLISPESSRDGDWDDTLEVSRSQNSVVAAVLGGVGADSTPSAMWRRSTPLCGCDAGVGQLVKAFMQGRSSRFNMFSLVKIREAVAIGTSILLMSLRGEARSRVGGCARSVGIKELRAGRLNAAFLAAESGIFEGITSDLSMDKLRAVKGNFATEAQQEAVQAGNGCALNYMLSKEDVVRYNQQRRLLLPRGVAAMLTAHTQSGQHMDLSEFALYFTASNNLLSSAAADYFFSVVDVDCDDRWNIADLRHFLVEKENVLLEDGMVLSGLFEVWYNLVDLVRPRDASKGIARLEFLRLSAPDRKTVLQSILMREDDHSMLNIRKTMELEGRRLGTAPLVALM